MVTLISSCTTLVIKIGSALLVDADSGALRLDWLQGLAQDVANARAAGQNVLIVSSGSIALGRRVLNMPTGLLSLEQSQAAAAVGQIRLARVYEEVLTPHGIPTAQVLVTLEDSANRRRYLNTRATLKTLMDLGVVPIVNENDTVATDEIRFGDNDRLGAQVAVMAGADMLVLLSDVDGLYTANPHSDATAAHLPQIAEITPDILAMAGDTDSDMASGGMATKLQAAQTATRAGCAMVIAKGDVTNPLAAIDNGAPATWFAARGNPQVARKNWISAMKTKGNVEIDAGAARALLQGKSLLPAGVVAVTGRFERGDPVAIVGPGNVLMGKGLAGYQSGEATAIIGRHSSDIGAVLGYPGRAALIHRDDMVL